MKTPSGDMLVTVKDIAACIAYDRSQDGIARTMRQVRHWTQSDLLRPYSEKNTGKGIPRLYVDSPTVEIAAILLEVSRYGATVDILRPVADELYDDAENMDNIFLATTDETVVYAQIAWEEDPRTGKFTGATVNLFNEMDIEDGEMSAEPTSSIVINLGKVMHRVLPFPWYE
jgi:hypothetical protein